MSNLEVKRGFRLTAAVADGGDDFTRLNPVADLASERLGITVKAHVTGAVVENDKKAETPKPVRKGDPTVGDGPHRFSALTGDDDTLPL